MLGLTLSLLDHPPTLGFSIEEKKLKNLFQIGFKNGGFFLVPLKIFSVLKFANHLIISKPIVKTFSLQEIVIHFPFVLNLGSLGFFVGNSLRTIFCQHHFPSIWLGNLKLNGGAAFKIS